MPPSTAFNKLLRLQGASLTGVTFGAEGVIAVRLRRPRCSDCGRRALVYHRATRRWRHLDLGAQRCDIEARSASPSRPTRS